ncbi:MAG: hypothetical protein LBF97_00330 [Elusimicrobiota bacterium]|jgi:hypothetical protein|nr:hypothetical protein [Elusimicrobiota bacterium]
MFKELVVSIFLNKAAAIKGFDEIEKKAKQSSNTIMGTFGKVGKVGAILGAGALGIGIKAVRDIYKETGKFVDFTSSFDMPVEKVSKFTNLMSMFGGSTDESLNSLQTLEQALIDLRTKAEGPLKEVSAILGIDVKNGTSSLDLIKQIRGGLTDINRGGKIKSLQELGIFSPSMMRYMKASDKEFEEMRKEAEKMYVINDKTAKNYENMQRTIAKMKQSWYGFGAVVLGETLGPIEKFTDKADSFFKKIIADEKSLQGLKWGGLTLLGTVLLSLTIGILAAHGPIIALSAAIVGIGATIAINMPKIKEGIKHLTPKQKKSFGLQFGAGATVGGIIGGLLGSVFPVVGTAIGATAGAAIGGMGTTMGIQAFKTLKATLKNRDILKKGENFNKLPTLNFQDEYKNMMKNDIVDFESSNRHRLYAERYEPTPQNNHFAFGNIYIQANNPEELINNLTSNIGKSMDDVMYQISNNKR